MIYYPLSTLMLAGIRDILVISTPQDTPRFEQCWATARAGHQSLLCRASLADGLAQAFIIGEEFIGKDSCALVWATTSSTAMILKRR